MFSTVRGEPRRAQAQQSDGDRGSHEENKGKKKHQRPESNPHTLLFLHVLMMCSMMEDRNVTLELHHNHTHNTKSVQLSHTICIEDIVTHALAGPRK